MANVRERTGAAGSMTGQPAQALDLLNAVAKSIAEIRIPIASIDDLIALKRAAGRAIDLADIEALERLKQLGLDR